MSTGRTISIGGASTSRRDAWTFGGSIAVHVVVLGWGALTFAARPLTSDATPMPIDIIFGQRVHRTHGRFRNLEASACEASRRKRRRAKPPDDPAAKIAKTEFMRRPGRRVAEPKPPTPEKKQSEPQRASRRPSRRMRRLTERRNEVRAKKAEVKPEESRPRLSPRPPQKEQPKFDPRGSRALLDKRTPQRLAATGDMVNSNVGIGAPNAVRTSCR